MKRSRSLRLVLMGGAALSLSACEEPVEVGVFETVEQCTVFGYGESACEQAIDTARSEHLQVAPRYATRADCEAEFGTCQSSSDVAAAEGSENTSPQTTAQSSSGSFFMPLVAGYMMGRMLGGGGYAAAPQPLYRPTGATARQAGGAGYYTSGGAKVASQPGLTRVSQTALSSSRATTSTLSRGGFGSRARAVSVAS